MLIKTLKYYLFMIVLKGDYRIVINKLLKGMLYALAVVLITYAIGYISGGGLPLEYSFYGAILVVILQAILKALEKYNPEYAKEFQWFFLKVFEEIKKRNTQPSTPSG